jgi:molybdenum cofactor synthesis domain-containing protein
MRAAVITLSTTVAAGFGRDESGPRLRDLARLLGADDVKAEVMPDDRERLEAALRHWADREGCSLILTSGGTGFAPTDHTPEATRAVIERDAPGIAEAMRMVSRRHTEHWMLSRAVAGIRGHTLIVNFPGSPNSIRETADFLAPGLQHALDLLAGRQPHPHSQPSGRS